MREIEARQVISRIYRDYPRFVTPPSSLHLCETTRGEWGVQVRDAHLHDPLVIETPDEAAIIMACLHLIHSVIIRA